MNDQAAAMGLPGTFEWNGQVWEFAPIDNLGVIRQFEDWLIRDAREQLQRERENETLSKKEYEDELVALRRDINAKMYAWNGSICVAALEQTAGLKQIVLLMLRARKRDVGTDIVDAIWKDKGELRRILLKMEIIQEFDDPNQKGPAAPGLSGPELTPTSCSPKPASDLPPPSGPTLP